MNPWLRRLHLVLTIGGGFAGLAVAFTTMGESFRQSLSDGFLIVGAILYFLCAIVIGVRFADGAASRTSLLWLYGVQVPLLSGPVIAYHLSLGAHVYVGVLGDSFYWNLQFGDHYSVSLGNGDLLWGVGVAPCRLTIGWSDRGNLFQSPKERVDDLDKSASFVGSAVPRRSISSLGLCRKHRVLRLFWR
jgi:hypothetical protein